MIGAGLAEGRRVYSERTGRKKEADFNASLHSKSAPDIASIFSDFQCSSTPVLMERYVSGEPRLIGPIADAQLYSDSAEVARSFERIKNYAEKEAAETTVNPHRILALPAVISLQALPILEGESWEYANELIAEAYRSSHQEILQILSQNLVSVLNSSSTAWRYFELSDGVLDSIIGLHQAFKAAPLLHMTSNCMSIQALYYYQQALKSRQESGEIVDAEKQLYRIDQYFGQILNSDPRLFDLQQQWIQTLYSFSKRPSNSKVFNGLPTELPPQSSEVVMARFNDEMQHYFRHNPQFEKLCITNNILAFSASYGADRSEYSSMDVTHQKISDFLIGCGVRCDLVADIANERLTHHPDIRDIVMDISTQLPEKDTPPDRDNPYSSAPFRNLKVEEIYSSFLQERAAYEGYSWSKIIADGLVSSVIGFFTTLLLEQLGKRAGDEKVEDVIEKKEAEEILEKNVYSMRDLPPLSEVLKDLREKK